MFIQAQRKTKVTLLVAQELINDDPSLSNNSKVLWNKVQNGAEKKHNSQMDVILALWNEGLIDA